MIDKKEMLIWVVKVTIYGIIGYHLGFYVGTLVF